MRLFTLLKNIILAIKSIELPTFTPVHEYKTITTSTSLSPTGISIKIPANSYVCVTATAVWGSGKPLEISVGWDLSDEYTFAGTDNSTGTSASASLSFYTDKECNLGVSAKYAAVARNIVFLKGFIITWGGQYLVRLLKGGVRYAAVSPVKECNPRAKEHLFPHDRCKHARRWLCGLSERLQGVLGTALQFQKWRYVYRTGIVWKWRCDDNSYLQLRYYGSMYFPWKRIRENCLYGGVGHAYQCRINGKHAIRLVSRSRAITHAGGDSYAAV